MDKIIVLAGPTASGKTALSVSLAQRLDGEIISADSMQVYRGMDIGTAKVREEEKQGIPHYLLDILDPSESCSAARYASLADPILQDILSRGKTAIIAGGTGLYIDALIKGREYAPAPSGKMRESLEKEADDMGMEHMLNQLRQVDPESAERLHLADRKRILRALEVYRETGITMTEHNRISREIPDRYLPLWLGLTTEPRSLLYDRINLRVDKMLNDGLLDEIRFLLQQGLTPASTALQAIGYKEFIPVLSGERSPEEATEMVKQGSRRYAKRQLTWFRRNPDMHWLIRGADTKDDEILASALELVRAYIL